MTDKKRILLVLERWWFNRFKIEKQQRERKLNSLISWESFFKEIFKELKGGARNGRKNKTDRNQES